MEQHVELPAITRELELGHSVEPTLGRGGQIGSRVTVGISDVLRVDDTVARQLQLDTSWALVSLSLRVSFRPSQGEWFERVLVSVLLQPIDTASKERPFARQLAPKRLSSEAYSVENGITLGVKAAPPGMELKAEASESVRKQISEPYVIAAGEGESDPEWRYQRTETMSLEGSYDMAMVVQRKRDVPAEAFISLTGTVVSGRQRTDVVWLVDDSFARVSLQVP